MTQIPDDIYAEQEDVDVHALAHLGPLAALAGVWEGVKGLDVNPFYEGERRQAYVERIELQPIDPQSNGPQLLYGLRYHTRIVKPGEVETYHDQVGYWLWEPATGALMHTLTIPRGQIVLATAKRRRTPRPSRCAPSGGPPSTAYAPRPFLEAAFRTDSFLMRVTVNADGTWSYFEDTVMTVKGRAEPFHHTDRNTLKRVEAPKPNPLAEAEEE
jgi:hypothetical protein